jgi:hypothetical protein
MRYTVTTYYIAKVHRLEVVKKLPENYQKQENSM